MMQYILNEDEFKQLKSAADRGKRFEGCTTVNLTTKQLQALCTKICNEMPVQWGWNGVDPKPWGCKLDADKKGQEWYCDTCPVQDLCPSTQKEYSK